MYLDSLWPLVEPEVTNVTAIQTLEAQSLPSPLPSPPSSTPLNTRFERSYTIDLNCHCGTVFHFECETRKQIQG
jgi:hypothetical protein